MMKPAAVYGNETWAMSEMDVKRMSTLERKILRIHGLVVEQGIWRVRTDQEQKELYKNLNIVADIKKKIIRKGGDI